MTQRTYSRSTQVWIPSSLRSLLGIFCFLAAVQGSSIWVPSTVQAQPPASQRSVPPKRSVKDGSAASQRYDELRQQYFRLRNTDLRVEQESEWRSVALELEQFTAAFSGSKEAPHALVHLSHLYEQLYGRSGSDLDRRKSLQALTRLVEQYPKSDLADDALFHAAEIMEQCFFDADGARLLFRRMLKRYPRSELSIKARAELDRLSKHADDNGTAPDALRPMVADRSAARRRRWMVVIDPGHGGEDFGARGPGGLLEKDVVLAVAIEAEKLLRQDSEIDVALTRRGDIFVPLAERTRLANELHANVFVSLHNNASENGDLSGLQTFYLDAAGDEASRLLAERENGAQALQGGGGDLALILSDLTQSAKQSPSITLAHLLHDAVLAQARSDWREAKGISVRPGPFYVLVGAHAPCALMELFFIDHEHDGPRLAAKQFRSALAGGVARGIRDFLRRQSRGPR